MIKDELTCQGNVHFPVSFLGCKLFCTGSPWLQELYPKIHRPALREVHFTKKEYLGSDLIYHHGCIIYHTEKVPPVLFIPIS